MDAVVTYSGKQVKFCDVSYEDYIGRTLLSDSWYELPNLEFIRKLNVPGNYVDVGAYIGTHSLFFSMFCPSDNVYSFEANPETFSKLKANLKANEDTKCQAFNSAISDQFGFGNFINTYENNAGGSQFVFGHPGIIECIPLDSMGLPDVKLIKIDVEGLELQVLRGAVETLKTTDYVFVEMWKEETCKQRNSEYTFPYIVDFLDEQGIQLCEELPVDDLYYFRRYE